MKRRSDNDGTLGSDLRPIPLPLQSLAAHLLTPHESLLWWGQPSAVIRAGSGLLFLSYVLAIGISLAGWLYFRGAENSIPFGPAMVMLSCVYVPLAGASLGITACQFSKARRTLYLLTTERLICCEPRWKGDYEFHEYGPERLRLISHQGWSNVPGSVKLPHGWMGPIRHPCAVFDLIVKTFLPRLPGLLKHPDNETRRQAILTVRELATRRQVPMTTLVVALHSDDSFIRQCAAEILGEIGHDAETALAPLRTATFDEDLEVSQAAFRAIAAIRGTQVSPAVRA